MVNARSLDLRCGVTGKNAGACRLWDTGTGLFFQGVAGVPGPGTSFEIVFLTEI